MGWYVGVEVQEVLESSGIEMGVGVRDGGVVHCGWSRAVFLSGIGWRIQSASCFDIWGEGIGVLGDGRRGPSTGGVDVGDPLGSIGRVRDRPCVGTWAD